MLAECPHCHQDLGLNAAQEEKVKAALAALAPGKTLKIACPKCRQAIELDQAGAVVGQVSAPEVPAAPAAKPAAPTPSPEPQVKPEPPQPPDLGWLASGQFEETGLVEDVPQALVAIGDEAIRAPVEAALSAEGYQLVRVHSAEEALEKMRFTNFEAVILHSGFEGGGLESSALHQHMRAMAMSSRRYIFYVLIGPEFHSLYDLQTLASSANLVVNDGDLNHFGVLLKKGLGDYAALFGPYIEALKRQGVK